MNISQDELKAAFAEYKATVMDVKNMEPNHVVKLSLDEQAEYADPMVKKYGSDPQFLKDIMARFKGIDENTSACTLGNLAYLAKMHNSELLLTLLQKLRE